MISNKKLRNLLLALLATITLGAVTACGETNETSSPTSSTTSEISSETQKEGFYTIKFVNEDGTELQSGEVQEGQLPVYAGETPAKAATAEYTYTFSGWDKEINVATENVTYTAQFTGVKNKYTVTFKNADGSVLQTVENVEYGTLAAYPETAELPVKAEDEAATYAFSGWNNQLAAVTGNVEYVATFTATYKEFSIKFMEGERVLAEKSDYHYGDAITPPETAKEENAQYVYEFLGWKLQGTEDSELVSVDATVSASKVYVAVYKTEVKKYDVEFCNGEEIYYIAEQVPYGELPVYEGETPAKYGLGTYEFAGWDKEISAVDGLNLKYNVVFNTVCAYTITSTEGEITAVYVGQDNELPTVANADISQATSYRFVVEDVNYTEHDSVSIMIGFNYNGMTVTAPNGVQIATAVKRDMMKISVMKDGKVYCNEELVYGAAMQDGVISFTITRNPETDLYAQVMCGKVSFDFVPKTYVNVADQIIAVTSGSTAIADATAEEDLAKGISKITTASITGWSFIKLNSISLSNYSELKFYIKKGNEGTLCPSSSGNWEDRAYDLIAGQWAKVTLTRNADGKYDVNVTGATKVKGYAPISSLSEIAISASKVGDAGIFYVSNLMGVERKFSYVSAAEQIFAPNNGTATVADATEATDLALGISKITTATITSWGIPTLGNVELKEYKELKFYIKRSTTGDIYQGGANWETDWAYQLIADQWAEVTLTLNADGKYDVTVSGANKKVKDIAPISNLNELIISCTKANDSEAGILYVSNLIIVVEAE